MQVFVGKNSTGKTRELIQYSMDTKIPIFAHTERKASSLREKSVAYFDKVVDIVTFSDLCSGYTGDILVDDIEKVCEFLLRDCTMNTYLNIAGTTITNE